MKPNNEHDNCAKCGEGKGECPIGDGQATYWLCEKCEADMFQTQDTTFIIQEIDKQIRHHKGEGNESACRSLEYIKEVVENG